MSEWASGSVDGLVDKSFGTECYAAARKKAVCGRDIIAKRSIKNPGKPKELYKSSRRKPWLTVYRRRRVFLEIVLVLIFFLLNVGSRRTRHLDSSSIASL